jgi:putative ABC transport system permease protein
MATRGIAVSLSRTGIAIAALSVAVATTVGVGVMIHSFRLSVADWLENYLRADFFVSIPNRNSGAARALIDPQAVAALQAVPGVATLSLGRWVQLASAQGVTDLFVLKMPRASFGAFRLRAGDPRAAERAFFDSDAVLVTEPYAYRHRVSVGDALELRTDAGVRAFQIVGVYQDYGAEQGVVTMSRATYERHWRDRGVTSLGVYAQPGADAQVLRGKLEETLGRFPGLVMYSNRALREQSLAIFDRTFAVTNVLRLLAVAVAFVGILSALMAIQLERGRELAVLRANGMTPAQVWGLVCTETGLMGVLAGVLALPLGLALSLLLITVINRRSFGWSMQVSVDPALLAGAVLLAVAAALLAGLYPAYRMARISPALALREE